jgi:hypothetical protein
MAEEMIEGLPFESDEAEDWEADEALAEAEDAAEDIGERAQRRRRTPGRRNYFRRARGVRGVAVPRQGGGTTRLPFPKPVATVDETNRGLAAQELARRDLDSRLVRLEAKLRTMPKKDASTSGLITLVFGGGLSAWGAFEAVKKTTGGALKNWADQKTTQMAAVASATQLATSGAKLAINGQYAASPLGITADAYSTLQLAAFAIGSLRQQGLRTLVANDGEMQRLVTSRAVKVGQIYITQDRGVEYEIVETEGGGIVAKPLNVHLAAPSALTALSGPGNPSPASGASGAASTKESTQAVATGLEAAAKLLAEASRQINAINARPVP